MVGLSVCGIHGVHPANKRLNVSTEVIVRRIFNPTKRRHIAPLSAGGPAAGEEMRRAIEGRERAAGFPLDLFCPALFDGVRCET